MKLVKFILVLFFAGLISVGCKSSSDDSSSSSSTTATSSDSVTGQTLPVDLAISSATETQSTTSSNISFKIGDTAGKQDHDSKKERMKGVMDATTKSGCFAIMKNIGQAANSPSCYGPTVNYIDHPDSTGGTSDGQLPGGDLGLWTSTEGSTGQACAAAKLNSLIQNVGQRVDMALGATAAMLCMAKIAGKELPASAGGEVDMGPAMKADADVSSEGGMTVISATLTKSDDTTGGDASYTSNITFSVTPPGRNEKETIAVSLKHVPLNADNTTYQGLITVVKTGNGGTVKAPPPPPKANQVGSSSSATEPTFAVNEPAAHALSVVYVRSATSITYKMISAQFAGDTASADMFNETTGEVNAANAGGTKGWSGDLNIALANIDDDGSSKLAYAWQAGSGDGYTRNFNVTTTTTGTTQTGVAYFGFAQNVNNAAPKLQIEGMICNWAGPQNSGPNRKNDASWSLIQKQPITMNTSTGIWEPSGTEKITFAPTKSCDWAASGASAFGTDSPPTTTSMTNNLELISNVVFTLPTEPTAPK